MLAAFEIAKELRQTSLVGVQLACYTFGAPRVGNPAFAKEYDELVQDSWSIVNDQARPLSCCHFMTCLVKLSQQQNTGCRMSESQLKHGALAGSPSKHSSPRALEVEGSQV